MWPAGATGVEERFGVVVAALPEDVAGWCYGATVLWVNGNQLVRRHRFTPAHEFGHACCGHDGRLEPDTIGSLSGRTTNPFEIQANAFAAEFLVPRGGLLVVVLPTNRWSFLAGGF